MPSKKVELTGVKRIENESVSLADVEVEACGKHEILSNGSLSCLGEEGLENAFIESQPNGHVQLNGERHILTGSPTIKYNGEVTPPLLDLAPSDDFLTTKVDGSVRIRIGSGKSESRTPLTVPQFFEKTVQSSRKKIALGVKRDGQWKTWTYEQYYDDILTVAKSFIKVNIYQIFLVYNTLTRF